jgi:hypothetical protein
MAVPRRMMVLFFIFASSFLRLFFVFSSSFLRFCFDKTGGGVLHFRVGMGNLGYPSSYLKLLFMASIKGNILTTGLSGKIGGSLVFYQRGGKQFARKMAEPRQYSSQLQLSRQELFREAVAYARQQRQDPEVVAAASARLGPGKSLYHVLISEFMQRRRG